MVKEARSENQQTSLARADGSSRSQSLVKHMTNEKVEKFGLTMPRWLFSVLTVVLGITASGLFVSTLALMTPFWSSKDFLNPEMAAAGKDPETTPLPVNLWENLPDYKLVQPMNILILGIGNVPNAVDGSADSFKGNSSTMLLVRLNPENKTIRVLSIPRDSMSLIPETGLSKISAANARGGSVLAARVVSKTLNNVRIDRYVRLSNSALRELVDQLGGVDMFISEPINFENPSKQLSVHLAKGWQTLNGEKADGFARYREPGLADLGRVQRQQMLLQALRDRLSSPAILPQMPQVIHAMRKYTDTNLKWEEMLAVVKFGLTQDPNNFQLMMLPGVTSRLSKDPDSYWLSFPEQLQMMNDYFGVSIIGVKPLQKSLNNQKISVQNAANNPKTTEKLVNYLHSKGFTKVTVMPDWPDAQHETQIIAQKANPEAAAELQKVLGLGTVEVSATGDLQSDLTIRLGKDATTFGGK